RLYAQPVAEAAPLFRLCGSGVVEQLSRKLDAPGGVGAQELAACRQRQSRTESGNHYFHRRILPPVGCAGEGVSAGCPARHGSPQALRNRPAYAQSLVGLPHLITPGFAVRLLSTNPSVHSSFLPAFALKE